jgi:hypothetical protein
MTTPTSKTSDAVAEMHATTTQPQSDNNSNSAAAAAPPTTTVGVKRKRDDSVDDTFTKFFGKDTVETAFTKFFGAENIVSGAVNGRHRGGGDDDDDDDRDDDDREDDDDGGRGRDEDEDDGVHETVLPVAKKPTLEREEEDEDKHKIYTGKPGDIKVSARNASGVETHTLFIDPTWEKIELTQYGRGGVYFHHKYKAKVQAFLLILPLSEALQIAYFTPDCAPTFLKVKDALLNNKPEFARLRLDGGRYWKSLPAELQHTGNGKRKPRKPKVARPTTLVESSTNRQLTAPAEYQPIVAPTRPLPPPPPPPLSSATASTALPPLMSSSSTGNAIRSLSVTATTTTASDDEDDTGERRHDSHRMLMSKEEIHKAQKQQDPRSSVWWGQSTSALPSEPQQPQQQQQQPPPPPKPTPSLSAEKSTASAPGAAAAAVAEAATVTREEWEIKCDVFKECLGEAKRLQKELEKDPAAIPGADVKTFLSGHVFWFDRNFHQLAGIYTSITAEMAILKQALKVAKKKEEDLKLEWNAKVRASSKSPPR